LEEHRDRPNNPAQPVKVSQETSQVQINNQESSSMIEQPDNLQPGQIFEGRYLYEFVGHEWNGTTQQPQFRCIGWMHGGKFHPVKSGVTGAIFGWQSLRPVELTLQDKTE